MHYTTPEAESAPRYLQVTEVARTSDASSSSALGLEVRLEKGCMSKAAVAALGGLQHAADRRCWVGRKVEETRQGEGQKLPESRDRQLGADFLSKLEEIWHRLGREWRCLRFGRNWEFVTFYTMSKL